MSDPQIEKGIPYPTTRPTRMTVLRDMVPGDSVLFENVDPPSLRGQASKEAKRLGFVIKTRQVTKGVRVWRMT